MHAHVEHVPFLTRTLAPFEVLSEEGLATLEENAERILAEVGIEFHDAPDARRAASPAPAPTCRASACGSRAGSAARSCRRPRRRSSRRWRATARTTSSSAAQGTIFAPAYGSPFVRDLDGGRRYGTIEDFRNFVKLAYASPWLHHSGGTVCEPVDVPVNKRHFDMVYAHLRYSDKPFMGSVTRPERARDTVDMARIVFGRDFVEEHTVVFSLINANSPLVWDATMLGAARAYAEANQARDHDAVHPRRRDEPVDGRGDVRADARRVAGGHGVRPARPARARPSCSARSRRRCRCSRARRRSARRSRRSCST